MRQDLDGFRGSSVEESEIFGDGVIFTLNKFTKGVTILSQPGDGPGYTRVGIPGATFFPKNLKL